MAKRIAMLGAGSGFTEEITKGLCACELLHDSTLVLMDIDDHLHILNVGPNAGDALVDCSSA